MDKTPHLSIVVTMVGGPEATRRCLERLILQLDGEHSEVIVPFISGTEGMAALGEDFPQVCFPEMEPPNTQLRSLSYAASNANQNVASAAAWHEFYDRAKAVGLREARGRICALLDDVGLPAPDWCGRLLELHHQPYDVVGGAVGHAGDGALNWAIYFQDFGRYQPPLRAGRAAYLTDINIAYKRESLQMVRHLWHERFNEVTVNWALSRRGAVLWLDPGLIVIRQQSWNSLRQALAERFAWGRLFGAARAASLSPGVRGLYALASPLIPLVVLVRTAQRALSRAPRPFLQALPALLLLATVWSAGEFSAYLTGKA